MRGLIGFETDLMNTTRGLGVNEHLFMSMDPTAARCGAQERFPGQHGRRRSLGVCLDMIQERGRLMVETRRQKSTEA